MMALKAFACVTLKAIECVDQGFESGWALSKEVKSHALRCFLTQARKLGEFGDGIFKGFGSGGTQTTKRSMMSS
jgi:hypothetical protein